MLEIVYTGRFKKDYKLVKKQGKDIKKLTEIIQKLVKREKLPLRFKDHFLTGNYKDRRECHVNPDWLLIYKIEGNKLILERTGSHSDLFK